MSASGFNESGAGLVIAHGNNEFKSTVFLTRRILLHGLARSPVRVVILVQNLKLVIFS